MGAILTQEDKLVDIFSKKYNEQKINYTNTEKEVLAITKALLHFKQLIYNSKIIIMTDKKNLLFNRPMTKRLKQAKFILEEFDYELRHISGIRNFEADLLSRFAGKIKPIENIDDCRPIIPNKLHALINSCWDKNIEV
ncbi:Transposon Tf2-9 polyprotein [Dictyocoela roeselum]|nr:Transposon Tf2-9 polyprotein [Dictyocoela roeselum]